MQFLPLNTAYRADVLWRKRLSVTLTTMLYAPEGLKQRKLYDEHLACLMRADHPAAASWDLDAYLAAMVADDAALITREVLADVPPFSVHMFWSEPTITTR
ncbi:MAG: hypothetical protein AAF718_04305 [Pseudomonadota bacterium]